MKKLISFPMIMAIALLAIGTSCKKSDAAAAAGAQSSSSLGSGRSSIVFSSSSSFAGSTSFAQSNTATTTAQTGANGVLRTISLSATEIAVTNTRTAFITFSVPASANTTSGSLTGDFSLPNNATILPVLSLSSTTGTSSGITYASQTGICTITKLTSTEIEGNFSCVVKDINGATTFSVTGASFAGKF